MATTLARGGTAARGTSTASSRFGDLVTSGLLVPFAMFLAWAPIPYASNRAWSWSLLALVTAALLLVSVVAQARGLLARTIPWPVWFAGATLLPVAAWAYLQTVPVADLPGFMAGFARAQPIWGEAKALLGDARPTMDLDPALGREALMRLLTYAGVFWLAFQLGGEGGRARVILHVLIAIATADAAYGIVNKLAGWDTVLWEEGKKAYSGFVTGTFVNRNSFATYCNIGVILTLGLLFEPFMRIQGGKDARRVAAEIMNTLLNRRSHLLVALITTSGASLLTASRGGFLSLLVAVVLGGFLLAAMTRPRWSILAPVVLVVGLGGYGIVALSGSSTLERLGDTEETGSGRTVIWATALKMIEERPLLGQGYGNFLQAWYPYRDDTFDQFIVDRAHDTYLEHAAELGLPATALLYAGPIALVGYVLRGAFVRRRARVVPLVTLTVTVLVAVHSLVDFSLQIPAVAVTYAAILGLGVAQSVPRRRRATYGMSLRE